jgi:hypothetical protein
MFWSQKVIPGKPRVLIVDGTHNQEGWEEDFCDRIFNVLRRKGVGLVGESPVSAKRPDELNNVLGSQGPFNCLFLLGHGNIDNSREETSLSYFWNWLCNYEGLAPKLVAICSCENYDAETSEAVLTARDSFAQLALAPQSPLKPREAGLFFMKFFAELDLHAQDDITGKMVWFCHSKATEILKRRHYSGRIGIRC